LASEEQQKFNCSFADHGIERTNSGRADSMLNILQTAGFGSR